LGLFEGLLVVHGLEGLLGAGSEMERLATAGATEEEFPLLGWFELYLGRRSLALLHALLGRFCPGLFGLLGLLGLFDFNTPPVRVLLTLLELLTFTLPE